MEDDAGSPNDTVVGNSASVQDRHMLAPAMPVQSVQHERVMVPLNSAMLRMRDRTSYAVHDLDMPSAKVNHESAVGGFRSLR